MKKTLKIDIVSDVVCPWCIVGYKRLEKALLELGIQNEVEIEWQPFELNPNMPINGQLIDAHMTEKYGTTLEQQKDYKQNMVEAGEELGFTFNFFEGMKILNTFEAHILLEYAKKFNKQTDLKLRLIAAYFSEKKNISQREFLTEALLEVGLNAEDAIAELDNIELRKELRNKQYYWKSMGINSVPTIVFNRKSAITGAQPVSVLKQVLTELLEKNQ